jgi:hypothetical protein
MFIDASLFPIGGTERLYISLITVANRLVTIWIGDPTNVNLASVSFDPLAPPSMLALADTYGRPAGLFVVDPLQLAASQGWSTGSHVFDVGATEFIASCVIPTPEPGVRGLIAKQGILLTGDAWLVGENGVVVSQDQSDPQVIRVDVVGDPLFVRRQCTPASMFTTPQFIKTINGVPPGPDGDFQFAIATVSAADTVLRIVPQPPDTLFITLVGMPVQGQGQPALAQAR